MELLPVESPIMRSIDSSENESEEPVEYAYEPLLNVMTSSSSGIESDNDPDYV